MFGTDIGWGVDGITNQPYQIAQKFLEGRNQFFQKIVSVKTIEPPFSEWLPERANNQWESVGVSWLNLFNTQNQKLNQLVTKPKNIQIC